MKRANALMIAMLVVMALSSCKKSTVELLEGTWEHTRENHNSECGKFRYDRGERLRISFEDISGNVGRIVYYENSEFTSSIETYPDAPASVGECRERILLDDFVNVHRYQTVEFEFELDEGGKYITIASDWGRKDEYFIKEISGNTLELKDQDLHEIYRYKKVK